MDTLMSYRLAIARQPLVRMLGLVVLVTALLVMFAGHAFAQAAGGGVIANGLGGRAQAASADVQTGGSYVFEMLSYLFAAAAAVAAGFTFWHHHKNRNSGEHRFAYGVASLLVAGFFAALPTMVGSSSETVSGTAGTVNAQPAQLTFGAGGGAGG